MTGLRKRLRMLEQGSAGIVCIPLGANETPENATANYKRASSTGKQSIVFLSALDLAL